MKKLFLILITFSTLNGSIISSISRFFNHTQKFQQTMVNTFNKCSTQDKFAAGIGLAIVAGCSESLEMEKNKNQKDKVMIKDKPFKPSTWNLYKLYITSFFR